MGFGVRLRVSVVIETGGLLVFVTFRRGGVVNKHFHNFVVIAPRQDCLLPDWRFVRVCEGVTLHSLALQEVWIGRNVIFRYGVQGRDGSELILASLLLLRPLQPLCVRDMMCMHTGIGSENYNSRLGMRTRTTLGLVRVHYSTRFGKYWFFPLIRPETSSEGTTTPRLLIANVGERVQALRNTTHQSRGVSRPAVPEHINHVGKKEEGLLSMAIIKVHFKHCQNDTVVIKVDIEHT